MGLVGSKDWKTCWNDAQDGVLGNYVSNSNGVEKGE